MTRSVAAVLVVSLLVASACGHRDDANSFGAANGPGSTGRRDSALVLGPGDVRIVNEDSSVEMAVVGQRIIVRLSDKTMAKVRRETDTMGIKDSGFGGSIERMVKRTVQSALGQQFEYPLADVRDARYENGEIILDVNGRQPRLLANTKVGGKKLLESFRPDDARRFVAAVNAKKPQ